MVKATEWDESVIFDSRTVESGDIVVRSITELVVTERKRIADDIFFECLNILRCSSGRFRFSFRDREAIEIGEGEVVVIYPRHIVTIDALGDDNRLLYGVIGGRDVVGYFDSMGFYDGVTGRTQPHYASIMELRKQLEAEKHLDNGGRGHCLTMLTDILTSQAAELRRQGNVIVFNAIRQIHFGLRNGAVRLKTLCEQLKISRVHLHRLFVQSRLGTPSEFIRRKQMYMIRNLLEDGRLSLSEVAERTGFLSAAHFTTFVKRMTGKTPTQLRRAGLEG